MRPKSTCLKIFKFNPKIKETTHSNKKKGRVDLSQCFMVKKTQNKRVSVEMEK